jgi:dTDP-4-dehydrorhamnose 3,5-epimerase
MIKVFDHSCYRERRGEIFAFYNKKDIDVEFVQDRMSLSYKGTLRGFHGDPETWKYITCPFGSLQLCTYDLLSGELRSFNLNENNKRSILIPPYYINAHLCLSHTCMFLYKQSEYYETFPADKQWTVKYNDPDIGAKWEGDIFNVSDRDNNGGSLKSLTESLGLN